MTWHVRIEGSGPVTTQSNGRVTDRLSKVLDFMAERTAALLAFAETNAFSLEGKVTLDNDGTTADKTADGAEPFGRRRRMVWKHCTADNGASPSLRSPPTAVDRNDDETMAAAPRGGSQVGAPAAFKGSTRVAVYSRRWIAGCGASQTRRTRRA